MIQSMNRYWTKATTVYILLPTQVIKLEPTTKNMDVKTERKSPAYLKTKTSPMKFSSGYYDLPSNGIALEEYDDYLIVLSGSGITKFNPKLIVSIARRMEKGLILRPGNNLSILFELDKIIQRYNYLEGYENLYY